MDNELLNNLSARDHDRIIEMAWEDRTPFEAIVAQFGLSESQVIVLMRRALKPSFLAALAAAGTGTDDQA